MKVHFGQIYIEPGVSFDFTHKFQLYLGEQVTALVAPSSEFIARYAEDFELMFRISAKKSIVDNEIRGPTVFKKAKDVEYTVFLPFDTIRSSPNVPKSALIFLFRGIIDVFGQLCIDTTRLLEQRDLLIESICSNGAMVG